MTGHLYEKEAETCHFDTWNIFNFQKNLMHNAIANLEYLYANEGVQQNWEKA